MREYPSLNFIQQIEIFESRGMVIEDKDKNAQKLEFINYYKLKELAYPFSKILDGELIYENISFNTLITRYYQDKNLRTYILHCIEKIEIAFKTQFSYIIGNKFGAYGYLEFNKWCNKDKYCKYYISEKQGNFKKKLKDDSYKLKSQCISQHFKENPNLDKVPIWMLIEELTFGEVLVLYEYMGNTHREQISNKFECTPSELESWLKALKFIRNQCAHNANIIDLTLRTKPRIRSEWKKYLDIDENGKPSGKLADVIVIMVFLTTKINNKYTFNDIQRSINNIVDKNDLSAKKLGFNSCSDSYNAIRNIGGYFKNRGDKPKIRHIRYNNPKK